MKRVKFFKTYDQDILQKKVDEWQNTTGFEPLSISSSLNSHGSFFVSIIYEDDKQLAGEEKILLKS